MDGRDETVCKSETEEPMNFGAIALPLQNCFAQTWYKDPRDHRCPHDAWVEELMLDEPSSGDRHEHRTTKIRIRLLGAYHDGKIEFHYKGVTSYSFTSKPVDQP